MDNEVVLLYLFFVMRGIGEGDWFQERELIGFVKGECPRQWGEFGSAGHYGFLLVDGGGGVVILEFMFVSWS